jgi:hypothetical protein
MPTSTAASDFCGAAAKPQPVRTAAATRHAIRRDIVLLSVTIGFRVI